MRISVIVPTHNRSRFVAETIVSLTEQTLAPEEIIVVDNGSTDDTAAVVRQLACDSPIVRYIVEPQLGVSRARNRGAAAASTEWIAFLDDDAVAASEWLDALAEAALDSSNAAAVGGPISLRWTRPAPPWVLGLESWYGHYNLGAERKTIAYPRYPYGSNVAFNREAFLAVGGFPAELGPRGQVRIANEEDGLFRKIAECGWAVAYEPRALVYHWVHAERLSRRYLLGRGFGQGESDVLLDAMFAGSQSRIDGARRSVEAIGEALDAGRLALTQRQGSAMRALMAASRSLGTAVGEARIATSLRRPPEYGNPVPTGKMIMRKRELAVQRFMLRTRASPWRHVWRALYAGVARGAALWLGREGGAAIYLKGSLAHGEPVYGLSDVDLVCVAPDRRGSEELARRAERMHRSVPLLRRLVSDVWIYERGQLGAATSRPYPTYELESGRAAFVGPDVLHDPMGLLERPGLAPPADEWRRLRGSQAPPIPDRDRQDERLVAWLELQYLWRWAFLASSEPWNYALAGRMVTLVAGAAQTWLWLARSESVPGRRAPLERASRLLESERETLLLAVAVHEAIPRCSGDPMPELWSCFVRISRRIADQIEAEITGASAIDVALDGVPGDSESLPLLDWRGLALPPIDWSHPSTPTAPMEHFSIASGSATDPALIADAAARSVEGHYTTLRFGPLLVRPTANIWGHGRLRGLEIAASDPVSFALADRRASAAFADIHGWSALDRARRAVAEHRAWLREDVDRPASRPGWVGSRPAASWATPATLSLLLSAARSALFLESAEDHSPRLTLTDEATVRALAERDPSAEDAAESALAALRACQSPPTEPGYEPVARLHDVVRRLPAYAEGPHG
jgi:GT2 family glycosyltransferase